MTQDEVYNEYVLWAGEKPEFTKKDLFRMSVANQDVYENASILVNHLYFLIVSRVEKTSRFFVFYEENTLKKMSNGDLYLLHSTYKIPEK